MLAVRGRRGRDVAGERRAGLGDTGLDDVSRRRESALCRQSSTAVDITPTPQSRSLLWTMAWPGASPVGCALQRRLRSRRPAASPNFRRGTPVAGSSPGP